MDLDKLVKYLDTRYPDRDHFISIIGGVAHVVHTQTSLEHKDFARFVLWGESDFLMRGDQPFLDLAESMGVDTGSIQTKGALATALYKKFTLED